MYINKMKKYLYTCARKQLGRSPPTNVKLGTIINLCQIGHLLYVITHFMEKFLKVFTIYGPGGHFDHVIRLFI